ncbi:hypothetical protein K435DRAFT_675830, partial [Dendrothele bispora CBS 962.96]
GEAPSQRPFPNGAPYTDARFPRAFIPYHILTANMREAENINANPDAYLAIVPFDAGTSYRRQNPTLPALITEFFKSFQYTDMEDITVVWSEPLQQPNLTARSRKDFGNPWPLIVTGFPESLKKELLYQQTYAVNKTLAFNVMKFDKTEPFSWVLANFVGPQGTDGPIRNTEACKNGALATIKEYLWNHPPFRNLTHRILGGKEEEVTTETVYHRTVIATASFSIEYIQTTTPHIPGTAMLQLRGCPITENRKDHEEWVRMIWDGEYPINGGLSRLTSRRTRFGCVHCKAATHPAHACPFPRTPGWYGPELESEQEQAVNQRDQNSYQPRRGRGRGRGRPMTRELNQDSRRNGREYRRGQAPTYGAYF